MNKVFSQTILYLGGDVFAKILPFLLIPYLTHTLGAQGYGELSFQISIMMVLSTIFCFGQDITYTKAKFSHGRRLSKYLFVFGGVFSLFIFLLSMLILNLFFDGTKYNYIVVAGFSVFLLNKIYSYYQVWFYVKKYILVQLLTGFSGALGTYIIFEYFSVGTIARIQVLLAVNLIVLLYFILSEKSVFSIKFYKYKKKVVAYFFLTSMPIFIHGLALSARSSLDRIILIGVLSLSSLGVFSLSYQIASIYFLILTSINKALMPHFFKLLNEKSIPTRKICNVSMLSFLFTPVVYLLYSLVPEELFLLVFGSEFIGVANVTGIFVLAFTLQIPYFILGNYLINLNKSNVLAISTLISSTIYILLIILIKIDSPHYVAVAFLISNLLQVTLMFIYVYFKVKEK